MAHYRAKRDYGYLEGQSPASAFDHAYRERNYGRRIGYWPFAVNNTLLRMFEGREVLDRDQAIAFVLADRIEQKRPNRGYTRAFEGDVAGNTLGWGVHLGLLVEANDGGRRTWTMPDREPWFVVKDGKAEQVRGMNEARAADHVRQQEALAKRQATVRAKAAAQNGPRIEAALNTVLLYDPGITIPAQAWPFPDDQWNVYLPTLTLPVPLVEVLPIVREAHETMEPKRQMRWRGVVERAAFRAKGQAEQRQRDVEHAAWVAARAAAASADEAALEDLA